MAATLTPTTTGHVFTRNPLNLSLTGLFPCVFSIYGQGYTRANPAYTGEVSPPAVVNLAEFIDAIVPAIDDPGEQGEMMSYGLQDGSVTVEVDDGSQEPWIWQINAHQGGVSKQNYRKLIQAGTDIFAARFFNAACNFFLTTRTHDWRLNIKETELYPLVFFYPTESVLAVSDVVSENSVTLSATHNSVDYHGKLCSLDLKAVRRYFLEEFDVIANVFDILVDGAPEARIAIQESRPQRERYRLKFRNSYGAFEIIEITGSAQQAPTFGEEEESGQYKRYQADIDDFESSRERIELSQVLNISTGYKTNDELRFLLDAVASDEAYLLDLSLDPIKVIVTVNEPAIQVRPDGPQAFNLVLTPVDSDCCIMTDLKDDVAPTRGGLFSEEFSEQFD